MNKSAIRRLVVGGSVALLTAAFVGCGGGGGGGSSPPPAGTAPTISNLQYAPQAAYVSSTAVSFVGQLSFTDPDGDLASATLTVLTSTGATVSTTTTPIQGASGVTSGSLQGAVAAVLSQPDNYTLQVFVTDLRGLRSNTLSGPIRIARFPWTSKSPAPTAREYAAVAALDGKLYVIGGQRTDSGQTPGPATGIVEVYDPQTDAWATAPSLPTARMGLVAVVAGGRIYAIGGATDGFNSSTAVVEAFDPATQNWTTRAPMPTARHFAGAALVGDRIVVAGGRTQADDLLGIVESYDPTANAWAAAAALPAARRELAAAEVGGRLFAAGGYAGTQLQWVPRLEAYDPAANAWTPRADMPTPRSHLALAAVGGRLIAAGGENVNRALDLVETYDPVANAWATRTPSPVPFTRAGAGVVAGKVYVFANGLTLEYDPASDIR